jgi:hypothetical protein
MSTIVDGVLIVVSLGGSEKGMIRKMRSQLEMVKASVIGVAVNKNEDFKVYGYYDQSKDSGKKDYLEFEKPKTLKDYFRKGNNNFKKSKNSQTQAESAGDEFGFPVDGSSSLGRKQVPRIENPESVLDQIMQSSNKSINYDDKISLKELAERNRSSEDHAKDSPSGNTSEQTLPQNPIRKNKAPIKQGNSQARKTSPSEPEEEIKPHVDGSADLNTFLDSIDPTKKNKKPGKGLFSR